MNNDRSVLRFEKYLVKSISFEINENYEKEDKKLKLDFDFDAKTDVKDNNLVVELGVNIFENAKEKKYPFEMMIVLKGFFSIEGKENSVNISVFEKNAIAILFPYLRAIVSTYTANANVPPVLLPAMNINEYIRRKTEYKISKQT